MRREKSPQIALLHFGHSQEAVVAHREALKEFTRERAPFQWASAQTHLGSALVKLGQRENGTARLEEAVTAFREASKEFSRERAPQQWSIAPNDLGYALVRLGEREGGTERLKEAAMVFQELMKKRTVL